VALAPVLDGAAPAVGILLLIGTALHVLRTVVDDLNSLMS
jgi:hypothetical protein